MRTEKEVKDKLEHLLKVQEGHSHKSETCSKCGQTIDSPDTWMIGDYSYLRGKITTLEWVLGQKEHLAEGHT